MGRIRLRTWRRLVSGDFQRAFRRDCLSLDLTRTPAARSRRLEVRYNTDSRPTDRPSSLENWTPRNCSTASHFIQQSRRYPAPMQRPSAPSQTAMCSTLNCRRESLRQTRPLKSWPRSVRNCRRFCPDWRRCSSAESGFAALRSALRHESQNATREPCPSRSASFTA